MRQFSPSVLVATVILSLFCHRCSPSSRGVRGTRLVEVFRPKSYYRRTHFSIGCGVDARVFWFKSNFCRALGLPPGTGVCTGSPPL